MVGERLALRVTELLGKSDEQAENA
jgi:hypothetical protein